MSMDISVIVPSFNRLATLKRALASVQAQLYQPCEIIVVDDASTDGTRDYVDSLPGVQLISLKSNAGAAHARNLGAERAKGQWLAFIDSDDVWLPHKLVRQLDDLDANNMEADLAFTGMVVKRGNGRHEIYEPAVGTLQKLPIMQLHTYPMAPSNWLVRKSVFHQFQGFDERLPNCEDWDLLVRMNQAGIRFRALGEPLTFKYNLPDSLDADVDKKYLSYVTMLERYPQCWEQDPVGRSIYADKAAWAALRAGHVDSACALLRQAIPDAQQPIRSRLRWLAVWLETRRAGNGLSRLIWPGLARAQPRASGASA